MMAWMRTDRGRHRRINEDCAWFDARRGLYAVADGMGGHLAGEVASRMAIDAVAALPPMDAPSAQALRAMMQETNRAILVHAEADEQTRGMGTTCTVLWLAGDRALIAHVGDSRVYRLRDGVLEQLTRDHSLVEEMIERGLITRAEARVHPRRNIITRALGTQGDNEPDVFEVDARPGDRWLLCSDGLTTMLSEAQMLHVITQNGPEQAADALLEGALDAGGHDNVTLILVGEEEAAWNKD